MMRNCISHEVCPDIRIHSLSFATALINAVRTAKSRVWIASYVFNANLNCKSDPITLFFSILREKAEKKIDIKIICDIPKLNRPNYHCNKFILRWLEEWDIPYCTPREGKTAHAKTIIVDTSHLFIGSHNLSKASLNNPLECTVELTSPGIICEYARHYAMIWHDDSMLRHLPPFNHDPGEPRPWMEHKNG